jgi:hypothetical protein
MSDPIRLTEMLQMAHGEVAALADLIALHRKKNTRPASWFEQNERTLQYRRQVIMVLENETKRRAADNERNAA